MFNPQQLKSLRGDIYGGITAAIVALPLALAFGVASGVGAISGLYGAIAVGFFAAVFGGTRSQVSGPTGPMTVVMGAIVTTHAGNLTEAFMVVFLAGFIQILFGLLKLGRFVAYTPHSVVSGFMSGIGAIIILIQIMPFFGLDTVSGTPVSSVLAWPTIFSSLNLHAAVISTITLAIMVFFPSRLKVLIPPAFAALLIGTALTNLIFVQAPLIGNVPSGLPTLHLPMIDVVSVLILLKPAVILALLGSIDSLLTSLVADSLTQTRHNSNKELIGQGIGNMVSGIIGGLPGAGATMRTVVNIRSGGSTPLSGGLHAVVLLSLVLGLAPLAAKIPHAVLAGILIKVGWDIIDWDYLRRAFRAPRDQVLVMTTTMALTVFVDLIVAVGIGIILSSLVTAVWVERHELASLWLIRRGQNEQKIPEEIRVLLQQCKEDVSILTFHGNFSYASARGIIQRANLSDTPPQHLVLEVSKVTYMDSSAAMAVRELIEVASRGGAKCFISGPSRKVSETLNSLGVFEITPHPQMHKNLSEAFSSIKGLN